MDRYSEAKFFGDSEVISREKVHFIIRELRSFNNRLVAETKMLFKYDPRAKLNFHNFIDEKENLFVVIRLVNNMTLAGFSKNPL